MKALKILLLIILVPIVGLLLYIGWGMWQTSSELAVFKDHVRERSTTPEVSDAAIETLPEPVKRYFAFTLPDGTDNLPGYALIKAEGDFRRPLTENFQRTTAEQILSTTRPDFVFHANTPILGPIWATAYDSYVNGQMEMQAKLMSAATVLHFTNDPQLDKLSLRRWLLEASSWPPALLPSERVTWEAIDDNTARALVSEYGLTASMIAKFDETGALTEMLAEEDGDLTTPYHGPGENVLRGDYQMKGKVRIPMSLVISRAAEGKVYPFWKATVTAIEFGSGS
ncbi:DUF6920 family protein [uncultured Cohaesibacter sp.]|uniref:DUF6920 family protein n=1 Tax=uncultured Cohaesibacter sp. TaxID=1002546 RepID=UPI0029C81559|nr:DUF6544 family protein [uncultured Cohaesibacter sp.]